MAALGAQAAGVVLSGSLGRALVARAKTCRRRPVRLQLILPRFTHPECATDVLDALVCCPTFPFRCRLWKHHNVPPQPITLLNPTPICPLPRLAPPYPLPEAIRSSISGPLALRLARHRRRAPPAAVPVDPRPSSAPPPLPTLALPWIPSPICFRLNRTKSTRLFRVFRTVVRALLLQRNATDGCLRHLTCRPLSDRLRLSRVASSTADIEAATRLERY